ncbi:MAG TPA: pirin family protein [Bryobacteraceae bacterium]|nr:pirin family protein [Bryobacteraceae bacterium]
MITIRRAAERGASNLGWLDSKHTFSFSRYFDPDHMGYRSLRVINDDRVAPGAGFGRHPHRDMEIISWVLSGELAHEDSTGSRATLKPGHVQRMSAGTGIVHSEFNGSSTEPVHFLQIWIEPNKQGIPPRFEDLALTPEDVNGKLRLVASPDGRGGSSVIQQDASVYITALASGETVSLPLAEGRHGWVQVAAGQVTINGKTLETGDGAAVDGESQITLQGVTKSDVLLFDLA